ncbi:hypothetical protein PF007_g31501, partial [Phytophthora fragariae]
MGLLQWLPLDVHRQFYMLHESGKGRVRCLGRRLRLVRGWRFDPNAGTSDGDIDCETNYSTFNFMFLVQRLPSNLDNNHNDRTKRAVVCVRVRLGELGCRNHDKQCRLDHQHACGCQEE